ncbi:MAG TPA: hypothetical protein VH253_04145 [Phycisphaerae bacterium]|nr:hypothetical protein [Phycisphaerae bacterium]
MSEQPPTFPPPLDYGRSEPRPGTNRWWMVILRALAGLIVGLASYAAGWGLDVVTDYRFPPVFLAPPALVVGAALFVAIRFRRYGYVTGTLLAPLVIAVGLVALLIMICGGGLPVHP